MQSILELTIEASDVVEGLHHMVKMGYKFY